MEERALFQEVSNWLTFSSPYLGSRTFLKLAQSMKNGFWHSNDTLWLCQNSYLTWPFIVDFPMKNGDFP